MKTFELAANDIFEIRFALRESLRLQVKEIVERRRFLGREWSSIALKCAKDTRETLRKINY